jgi:hypothetical protein
LLALKIEFSTFGLEEKGRDYWIKVHFVRPNAGHHLAAKIEKAQ